MGLFRRLFGKKTPQFTPEEAREAAELSAAVRKANHALKMAEMNRKIREINNRIADEEEDLHPEPDQPAIDPMMIMLLGMLFKGQNTDQQFDLMQFIPGLQQATAPKAPTMKQASVIAEISDEEIREQLSKIPKNYVAIAKKLDPAIIRSYIKKNFSYSDDTIERAIAIIKNE